MKRLLIAALLLAPLPALAQEAVTVSAGSTTESWNMSASDQLAFEEWVQSAYPCTPVAPATTCTTVLADSQAAWAQATIQGTIDNVNRYHKLKAAEDAAAGVPPVGAPVEPMTTKAKAKAKAK